MMTTYLISGFFILCLFISSITYLIINNYQGWDIWAIGIILGAAVSLTFLIKDLDTLSNFKNNGAVIEKTIIQDNDTIYKYKPNIP